MNTFFTFSSLSARANALGFLVLGMATSATLASSVQAFQLQQDFAGAYAPGSWTFTSDPALGDGSVNLAAAPDIVTLTGSDSGDATAYFGYVNTDYTIIAAASGPVSFDWSFFSQRVHSPDGFGYLLNGSFTQLADQSSLGSGFSQFNVLAGDVFGFRAYTLDNGVGPGLATISNFSAPISGPTPVPGPLPLLGVGAALSCSRRLRRRASLADGPVRTATATSDQGV
jgi:hypothetical protein